MCSGDRPAPVFPRRSPGCRCAGRRQLHRSEKVGDILTLGGREAVWFQQSPTPDRVKQSEEQLHTKGAQVNHDRKENAGGKVSSQIAVSRQKDEGREQRTNLQKFDGKGLLEVGGR